MKQLIQDFKTGDLKIEDVPDPLLKNGFIKVKNKFSLISTGTEKSTVDIGKASLVEKAKKRPDLVKQVFQNIKKEGLIATFQKVRTKLDTPRALGYSCSGVIVDTCDFDGKFKKGDRIACAGQDYASHAEIVCCPQNLVVEIPDNVTFKEAAFTTIGAIALQGVRQADPKIGEKICVIGLGLIGQITMQILTANGCSVCGIDISIFAIDIAKKIGINTVFSRNDENLYTQLDAFTSGHGFDKVIITASTTDNDPIILATEILRLKGVIIVVGDVKMDIPREPYFYKKELELKIATSYGPGRYDPLYEEAGIDYPYAYVRFTENRNMRVFLELVSNGSVKLQPLITHIFKFENALDAYALIISKKQREFIGVLLEYKDITEDECVLKIRVKSNPTKAINIGFIGAGSFAKNYLLPYLKTADVSLDTIVTTRGITSKNAAKRFGFNFASSNTDDIMSNEKINTVFIATRHDTHTRLVCEALKKGKHIFVEKPLCLNLEELKEICSTYTGEQILMVGFNRRFAPISLLIRKELEILKPPLIMNFRINAGCIPGEHWIQNIDVGGGRIVGEVCHFVDLMLYLSNSRPIRVYASSIKDNSKIWRSDDNLAVVVEFADGSVGSIVYTAMGDSALGKEYLEIFAGGNTYLIDDFKKGLIYKNGRLRKVKNQGKGHKEEIQQFINALKNGSNPPADFQSLVYTMQTTFKILDSLIHGQVEHVLG